MFVGVGIQLKHRFSSTILKTSFLRWSVVNKVNETQALRDRLIVMDWLYHLKHVTCRERCRNEHCIENAQVLWGSTNPNATDIQEWYDALDRNDLNKLRVS